MKTKMDQQSKEKAEGKVGLVNLGNTCFLNAAIQSLRYCTPLTNYFLTNSYESQLKQSRPTASLVEETADVFKGMWNSEVKAKASMAPRGFIASASRIASNTITYNHVFSGGQSDSSEVLLFLLDSIHEAVSRQVKMDVVGNPKTHNDIHHIKSLQAWSDFYAKGYSPVIENFFGQTMTATICRCCKNKNTRFEPWMMMKAPIASVSQGNPSLSACIDKLFDSEVLDEYQCDNCEKSDPKNYKRGPADLEHTISKLPPILIVQLNRFDNNNNKINTKVDIDINKEDFAKWLSFPAVSKHISTEYSLFAAIEHHGGSRGGHYVSYAKHDDNWILYDDTSINSVSESNLINNNTYILFLTRNKYSSPQPIVSKD